MTYNDLFKAITKTTVNFKIQMQDVHELAEL